jgi:hypothetical protein
MARYVIDHHTLEMPFAGGRQYLLWVVKMRRTHNEHK